MIGIQLLVRATLDSYRWCGAFYFAPEAEIYGG